MQENRNMNYLEKNPEFLSSLTDLVNSKMSLITALDPSLFFDGSKDGGLEDGVSGKEGRAIKFWAKDPNDFFAGKHLIDRSKKNYDTCFDDIIQLINSLENISHAFIFFINPGYDIPWHKDDEDPTKRIIIGLNEPGEDYALKIDTIPPLRLKKNQFIELDAQTVSHGGWNRTSTIWNLLVLCFSRS
jgi:hypothetical protein